MNDEKFEKILELTEYCYYELEMAQAVISLLQNKFAEDKTADVALNITLSNIKNATELILKIQNNI